MRHLGSGPGALDDLPGFWGRVGSLYAEGRTGELAPDPVIAAGVTPPLSATFRDLTPTRAALPALDPTLCTGCARCLAACPDGSIAAAALTPRQLLDAASSIAGRPAGALRQFSGAIAARASRIAAAERPASAGALLARAAEQALERVELPADRAEAAGAARAAVAAALDALPVSRTAAFFDDDERDQRGSGALFSLVIDPTTCKACAGCVAACAPGALSAAPQTPARVAAAGAAWSIWERLPDTPGARIERAASDPRVDPIGALLLSRHSLLAMAGADAAEPGSGERLALRLALGVAEARLQPRRVALAARAAALAGACLERVRALAASGVPTGDLDALARGLSGLGAHEVDVGAWLSRVGAEAGGTALSAADAASLAELVGLARALQALGQRLTQGATGLGRARLGLVLGPSGASRWAALFPHNPFQVPTARDGGAESAALTRGLMEAQVESALADLELLRRGPPPRGRPGAAGPVAGWSSLTAEERRDCPPILLVGDDRLLQSGGLDALLATGLPVRVLVLSDADLFGASLEPAALAGARARGAFALQGSLAAPGHLALGITDAFAAEGPAVIRVHAPSPGRHGFASDGALRQAELALSTRAWPIYRLEASGDGVFGALLDLAGNPEPGALQVTLDGRALSPADFAASEARFAGRGDEALAAAVAARLSTWRVIQELAGVVTPFTAMARAQAEEELRAAHDEALGAARAEGARRLEGAHNDLAARLRDNLLRLAGYPAPEA